MRRLDLQEVQVPRAVMQRWPPGVAAPRLYRAGALAVLVGQEQLPGDATARWHLSVSHPSRYPSWDEIGAVRDALLPPEVCFCVPHPPRSWWLSIHPNCFHLWEVRDATLVEQWRYEGEGARRLGHGVPEPAGVLLPRRK